MILKNLRTSILSLDNAYDWAILQARAVALVASLEVATQRVVDLGLKREVADSVAALATSDRVPLCERLANNCTVWNVNFHFFHIFHNHINLSIFTMTNK